MTVEDYNTASEIIPYIDQCELIKDTTSTASRTFSKMAVTLTYVDTSSGTEVKGSANLTLTDSNVKSLDALASVINSYAAEQKNILEAELGEL